MSQNGKFSTQFQRKLQPQANSPLSAPSFDIFFNRNTKNSFKNNPIKESVVLFVILITYFLAGKLGLKLAFENASATAVWAPTGIAITAFLLRGYYVWPVILLGAFLINITTTGNIPTSVFIAIGNTSEGLFAAYLVNKYAGGKYAFEKAGNVFKFAFFAGIISTAVSATMGVTSLAFWGFAQWSNYLTIWLTWWVGDAVGAFLLVPLLILWFERSPIKLDRSKLIETAAVFVVLALISFIEFSPSSTLATKNYPLSFILIPPFVWIAFRFDKRFVATAAFLVCAVAIWGTLMGFGPFVTESRNNSLVFLQAFISIVTVMSLAFASVVSQHNESERIARDAETEKWKEFFQLLEKLPAGAYTCNGEGLITYYNEKAVKIWGREPKLNSPDDRYCGSFKLYVNNKSIKHNQCWMAMALNEKIGFNGEEIGIERPDGTILNVLAHANPIYDKFGNLTGAVNVLVDISDLKKAQSELEEAYNKMEERVMERTAELNMLVEDMVVEIKERKEAEVKLSLSNEKLKKAQDELVHSEKLASLGRFSAGIAHEIRNPLANISSLAQLLIRKNPDSEANKHLNYIITNANIANNIIKELLSLASRDNINFQNVNIASLIDNIYNSIEARCKKNKIILNKNISNDIPDTLINEDKMQTAFLNLISNAIEAMPTGGRLDITGHADHSKNEAVISFIDTGSGIPVENLSKVLEPFFTTKHDGTGLGLSLTYHVVQAHGGRIEIESKINEGTKFTIRLPLKTQDSNTTPVNG